MAIEYGIPITTTMKLDDVRRLLRNSPAAGQGINDWSILEPSQVGKSIIFDALHFTPTVEISAHIDKFDPDVGEDNIARLMDFVLRSVEGDAALLYNWEVPLAVRKNHQVVLNKNSDFWTKERLQSISAPFSLAGLANVE